jgi:hypothetical protein
MRLARLIGGSFLTGVALLGTAQPAFAKNGEGVVTVSPASGSLNTGRAGMTAWVYDGDLCAATTATATSRAFTARVAMTPGANMLMGTATIAHVAPGRYRVRVHCDGRTYLGAVTVLGSVPRGGAATGDGSSLGSSLDGGAHGAATGLALTAAGVGLGGLALRRTRRR